MKRAFTIIEIIVVVAIIGILSVIVVSSTARSRSFGRDSQVKSDTQSLKLAFARAAQADPNQKYPGTPGTWYCLKTSGTCFRGGATADTTLNTTMATFLPGGEYPVSPFSKEGELRHDSYVYTPSPPASPVIIPGYTGALILWWQEKPILGPDCNGFYAGQTPGDTGVYYCYEKLQ